MDRGDIYLAPFTYADLQGSKRRPVCVVSSAGFNSGLDVIVVMVTSRALRLSSPGVGEGRERLAVQGQDGQAASYTSARSSIGSNTLSSSSMYPARATRSRRIGAAGGPVQEVSSQDAE